MSEAVSAKGQLLTKAEASKILRVSPITIHRLLKAKKLGCFRIGSRVFIGEGHVQDFLAREERRPKAA